MKALSIKQPWASLICTPRGDNPALGIKDIENRTWKTNFRGRIYVHASSKTVKYTDLIEYALKDGNEHIFMHSPTLSTNYEEFKKYPHGAIIGEIDIIDCVINNESIWAEKSEEFRKTHSAGTVSKKPIYNWVLANPVLYEKPIPCKGKLSFWEPDFDIEECIWCSGKFDFEIMSTDGTENYCPECWKEAEPLLQAEYDELKANGEID